MIQGELLAMVAYGIGILPLINNLKAEFLDVAYPWYADDYGALVTFARVSSYFNLLKWLGLGRGYYPKPSKIVLIVHPYDLKCGGLFGSCHGFNPFLTR